MKNRRNPLFVVILLLVMILLLSAVTLMVNKKTSVIAPQGQKAMNYQNSMNDSNFAKGDGKVYKLDLKKWGVFNDGTHPEQTTKGINTALKWAKTKGYTTFYVPAGTYLISKGKSDSDPNSRINLVSNMTFLLDQRVVIQKETNGFEIYSTLYLDSQTENVTIRGGTLRGDRETHDYSRKEKNIDGTHEWGDGIYSEGARNITIDQVKIEKFTGDGIEIGGTAIYGDYITEKDLELGSIDNQGKPISQKGKIRSNNYHVENFNNVIYKNPHYRNVMMWLPKGVNGNYDIFFYRKDGSFIKADRNQHFNSTWGFSRIPDNADYFRVVFNSKTVKNIEVNRMTAAITENMTIKNCDIGYNRRQGITVGASENIKIINNKIHHIKGTSPQSGIDIEPGFYPAINTLIKSNKFLNNKIHIVLAYGGNTTITDNYFGPNISGGLGLSVNPNYYGTTVDNNKFDHTNFITWGNTKFLNNKLTFSLAKFEGGENVIVDGVDGTDSNLEFTQTDKDGIIVSNVMLTSSKGNKNTCGITVSGKPLHLTNITLLKECKSIR